MITFIGDKGDLRVYVDNTLYNLTIGAVTPIIDGIRLFSSDGYALVDINGIHLVTKEDN